MDQRTEVAWMLIYEMLIGSATSIIPKTLENVGDDYIGSLNKKLQQWTMTMGVTGLNREEEANDVKHHIYKTLDEISQNGFDDLATAAALNKVEFQIRELNTKCGIPQGVHMFQTILTKWNYDEDPRLVLSYYNEFKKLRDELEDPDNVEGKEFILELVTLGLIDNSARSVATIYPSTSMQESAERVSIFMT
jgi:Zn-dependent M16 (insulinase) family peptidase